MGTPQREIPSPGGPSSRTNDRAYFDAVLFRAASAFRGPASVVCTSFSPSCRAVSFVPLLNVLYSQLISMS